MAKKMVAAKVRQQDGVAPKSGHRPVLQFRVHEALYESLKAYAADQKLTISEAAADMLSRQMNDREIFPGIQKMMMLIASVFWHAVKMKALSRGLSSDYADSGEWLKDADCYRAGAVAVMNILLKSGPIESREERLKTIKTIKTIIAGLA